MGTPVAQFPPETIIEILLGALGYVQFAPEDELRNPNRFTPPLQRMDHALKVFRDQRDMFMTLVKSSVLRPILLDPRFRNAVYRIWIQSPLPGLDGNLESLLAWQIGPPEVLIDLPVHPESAMGILPFGWYTRFLATAYFNDFQRWVILARTRWQAELLKTAHLMRNPNLVEKETQRVVDSYWIELKSVVDEQKVQMDNLEDYRSFKIPEFSDFMAPGLGSANLIVNHNIDLDMSLLLLEATPERSREFGARDISPYEYLPPWWRMGIHDPKMESLRLSMLHVEIVRVPTIMATVQRIDVMVLKETSGGRVWVEGKAIDVLLTTTPEEWSVADEGDIPSVLFDRPVMADFRVDVADKSVLAIASVGGIGMDSQASIVQVKTEPGWPEQELLDMALWLRLARVRLVHPDNLRQTLEWVFRFTAFQTGDWPEPLIPGVHGITAWRSEEDDFRVRLDLMQVGYGPRNRMETMPPADTVTPHGSYRHIGILDVDMGNGLDRLPLSAMAIRVMSRGFEGSEKTIPKPFNYRVGQLRFTNLALWVDPVTISWRYSLYGKTVFPPLDIVDEYSEEAGYMSNFFPRMEREVTTGDELVARQFQTDYPASSSSGGYGPSRFELYMETPERASDRRRATQPNVEELGTVIRIQTNLLPGIGYWSAAFPPRIITGYKREWMQRIQGDVEDEGIQITQEFEERLSNEWDANQNDPLWLLRELGVGKFVFYDDVPYTMYRIAIIEDIVEPGRGRATTAAKRFVI